MEENTNNRKPPVKIWKVSIPKNELAELPAASYEGKISVIDKQEMVGEAIAILRKESEIGFDTETRPSFKKGQHYTVSLLQLSTRKETFLFRLNKIGIPKELIDLLEDPTIIKIGLSINDDFMNLRRKVEINPDGFIDLQSFVKNYHIADNSLSRIYGILFGKRISKGQRLTNWEAEKLTEYQEEYSALDAMACLHIYDHLLRNGYDWQNSIYYREYEDPSLPQPKE